MDGERASRRSSGQKRGGGRDDKEGELEMSERKLWLWLWKLQTARETGKGGWETEEVSSG